VMQPSSEGTYTIKKIYPNSPAEDAGLVVGDRIIKINDREAGSYDYFELRPMLKQARSVITMLVERDDKRMKVEIELRRVI